jgi:hypothetical protein
MARPRTAAGWRLDRRRKGALRRTVKAMETVQYTRKTGLRLTYRIEADEHGRFTVTHGAKELLRGRDRLAAVGGSHRAPNRRKVAGAIAQAERAIEALALMDEC